jgi:hypothetical protein
MRTLLFLPVLVVVLTGACGGGGPTLDLGRIGPDSSVPSSSGSGADGGSFPGFGDATGCTDSTTLSCSADGHSVVDCNGAVVQMCDPTQACAGGTCMPACAAAVANKSSVGCEYYAHNPTTAQGPGCYALYVANTWVSDVSVTSDINGTVLDLSKYTYLPSGTGTSLTMAPIGAGGTIPPGKVGVIFLRNSVWTNFACGLGVQTADTDPAASAWTDPYGPSGVNYSAGTPGTNNLANALHVVASAPVVVYDIFPFGGGQSGVTDAALLLPTSTWDTNYIAVTPQSTTVGSSGLPFDGTALPVVTIIASSDGTNVTIDPTVAITAGNHVAGTAAGVSVTYPLNKGQVLRLEQPADLSGSVISSDKPVGVWGEQGKIWVPDINVNFADSAHEQIPPIRALGSEYVYARYRDRVNGRDETPPTRIVGVVDGTVLTWDPAPTGAQASLSKGQSFEVQSSGPFVVKSQDSSHPFYVVTYMTGGGPFNGAGDPEFVSVVPSAQYLSQYDFFTDPTYPETNLVFIRKLGADNKFHDVQLDCAGTLTGWTPVGSSGQYQATWRDLSRHDFAGQGGCNNGAHQAQSTGPFTLTVWGWGTTESGGQFAGDPGFSQYVSYAYPAGEGVQSVNMVVVPPTNQ